MPRPPAEPPAERRDHRVRQVARPALESGGGDPEPGRGPAACTRRSAGRASPKVGGKPSGRSVSTADRMHAVNSCGVAPQLRPECGVAEPGQDRPGPGREDHGLPDRGGSRTIPALPTSKSPRASAGRAARSTGNAGRYESSTSTVPGRNWSASSTSGTLTAVRTVVASYTARPTPSARATHTGPRNPCRSAGATASASASDRFPTTSHGVIARGCGSVAREQIESGPADRPEGEDGEVFPGRVAPDPAEHRPLVQRHRRRGGVPGRHPRPRARPVRAGTRGRTTRRRGAGASPPRSGRTGSRTGGLTNGSSPNRSPIWSAGTPHRRSRLGSEVCTSAAASKVTLSAAAPGTTRRSSGAASAAGWTGAAGNTAGGGSRNGASSCRASRAATSASVAPAPELVGRQAGPVVPIDPRSLNSNAISESTPNSANGAAGSMAALSARRMAASDRRSWAGRTAARRSAGAAIGSSSGLPPSPYPPQRRRTRRPAGATGRRSRSPAGPPPRAARRPRRSRPGGEGVPTPRTPRPGRAARDRRIRDAGGGPPGRRPRRPARALSSSPPRREVPRARRCAAGGVEEPVRRHVGGLGRRAEQGGDRRVRHERVERETAGGAVEVPRPGDLRGEDGGERFRRDRREWFVAEHHRGVDDAPQRRPGRVPRGEPGVRPPPGRPRRTPRPRPAPRPPRARRRPPVRRRSGRPRGRRGRTTSPPSPPAIRPSAVPGRRARQCFGMQRPAGRRGGPRRPRTPAGRRARASRRPCGVLPRDQPERAGRVGGRERGDGERREFDRANRPTGPRSRRPTHSGRRATTAARSTAVNDSPARNGARSSGEVW
jgi:hypothetical protein